MKSIYWAKAVASIAVCTMGSYTMYITDSSTGIGWAIIGLMLIWGAEINITDKDEDI